MLLPRATAELGLFFTAPYLLLTSCGIFWRDLGTADPAFTDFLVMPTPKLRASYQSVKQSV